jgi:hypothetical protein
MICRIQGDATYKKMPVDAQDTEIPSEFRNRDPSLRAVKWSTALRFQNVLTKWQIRNLKTTGSQM